MAPPVVAAAPWWCHSGAMDLSQYVEHVRHELGLAAEAGGEESRAVAERLVAPLESAIRLTLLDALSAATAEITTELAPGSVDLRLRGREPGFVVTPPPAEQPEESAVPPASGAPDLDEGATSRINFRLPEQLKFRIEEAAAAEGLSVNAWLVRIAAAGLGPARGPKRAPRSGQRFTGWVR